MPEHASHDLAAGLFDQQSEEHRIADWGGDELFTRMPRPRRVDDAPAPRFRPSLIVLDQPEERRRTAPGAEWSGERDRRRLAERSAAEAAHERAERLGIEVVDADGPEVEGHAMAFASDRRRRVDPGRHRPRPPAPRRRRLGPQRRAPDEGHHRPPRRRAAPAADDARRAPPSAAHPGGVRRPAPRADHGLGLRARAAAHPGRDLHRGRRGALTPPPRAGRPPAGRRPPVAESCPRRRGARPAPSAPPRRAAPCVLPAPSSA